MIAGFLRLLGVTLLMLLPEQVVPADVVPLPDLSALLVEAVIGLGLFVITIVVVAVVVIKRIKKKHAVKDDAGR